MEPHLNLNPTSNPMTKELILAPIFSLGNIIKTDGTLAVNPEAIEARDALVSEALSIPGTPFTTPAERDHAIQVASRIKGQMDDAERDRVAKKDAFLKIGAAIDQTKKNYVSELDKQRTRLSQQIGAFNEAQRLKAQREQEERDREARRLQQEAEEKRRAAEAELERLRKEQEAIAEKQRKAQEAAEAKGKALTAAQQKKQLQEELAAEERREAAEAEARQKQADMDRAFRQLESEKLAAAEKLRQEKATGGAQRTEIDIEVTNAQMLYNYNPSCVKLVPDLAQIKFLINSHKDDPEFRIPGVIFAKRAVFSARGR